jgi:hypothetical protein
MRPPTRTFLQLFFFRFVSVVLSMVSLQSMILHGFLHVASHMSHLLFLHFLFLLQVFSQ